MKSLDTDTSSKWKDVLSTDNRNYQMFAYCPTVSHKVCGLSDDDDNEEMRLQAHYDS
jgi:hypothetical protein